MGSYWKFLLPFCMLKFFITVSRRKFTGSVRRQGSWNEYDGIRQLNFNPNLSKQKLISTTDKSRNSSI